MTKTIYFHIDEVARDAVVAANLERVLKPHRVRLVFGNRLLSSLIQRFKSFRNFDLYIFPGIDHFKTFVPDLSTLKGKVVILPTEAIGGTDFNSTYLATRHLGADPEEHIPWRNQVSAFCSWGPSLLEMFKTEAPELSSKCQVVGHPRHDRRCQGSASAQYQPSKKIKVGLISRFSKFNVFDRRGMLRTIHDTRTDIFSRLYLSPGREIEDQFYTEAVDLRVFFDLIKNLDPNLYEMYLRIHPREDRTAWNELVVYHGLPVTLSPWDQPFMHWLNQVDHVVGPPSTSFYDCFVAGKIPISTQDIAPSRKNHVVVGSDDENRILDHVVRPKSMEELLQLLSVPPKSRFSPVPDGVLELLKQQTNYPDSANSIDALSHVCLQVLDHSRSAKTMGNINRLKIEFISMAQTGLHGLSRTLRRQGPEQSSSFLLTRKRKAFIRRLALVK